MRGSFLSGWTAAALLALASSTTWADSITSYSATDLGPASLASNESGGTTYTGIKLSSTGEDGTLTAPNGKTVYAFPRTDNLVANPQSLIATLPPLTNAPVNAPDTYNSPSNAFSYFANVFLNKSGEFVATNAIGVQGHSAAAASFLETTSRQADGSFGPLQTIAQTNSNYSDGLDRPALALDLNNQGKVLGLDMGANAQGFNAYFAYINNVHDYFIYDLNTGVRTELASLLPIGWTLSSAIAIDDQGRVLVAAQTASSVSNEYELFLLTPAGLSSDPIATPEPSTLATLAAVGVGLAARRRLSGSSR